MRLASNSLYSPIAVADDVAAICRRNSSLGAAMRSADAAADSTAATTAAADELLAPPPEADLPSAPPPAERWTISRADPGGRLGPRRVDV